MLEASVKQFISLYFPFFPSLFFLVIFYLEGGWVGRSLPLYCPIVSITQILQEYNVVTQTASLVLVKLSLSVLTLYSLSLVLSLLPPFPSFSYQFSSLFLHFPIRSTFLPPYTYPYPSSFLPSFLSSFPSPAPFQLSSLKPHRPCRQRCGMPGRANWLCKTLWFPPATLNCEGAGQKR